MKSLIETFPGARFVVCVRSPFETMPSIAKMMKRNWQASGSDPDPETIASSLELLLDNSVDFYLHPLDDLSELVPERWQVVRYEDLVERPADSVRDVYAHFGLEVTAETEERLRRAENDARAYRPDHRYSLDEFGLTTEEIEMRLAPVFDRFDWPRPEAN